MKEEVFKMVNIINKIVEEKVYHKFWYRLWFSIFTFLSRVVMGLVIVTYTYFIINTNTMMERIRKVNE